VARGVAVKGVNIGDVRPMPILLPPLAEQTRIVAEVERRLSVVEELEWVVSANLQRATRLRQSILQKAFTGKLTNYYHSKAPSAGVGRAKQADRRNVVSRFPDQFMPPKHRT